MEIPLYVLVLQIGFNAALNNRGYNGNPLIPSARFVNSGQTRRLPELDSFVPLSSRGIPASDSEQSDDDYSSFEDYSFRSVRPNQKRNDYLRYNTGPENDVNLESAPLGRINSNNYVDSLQSSSSLSRRTDLNFRRPYLRKGPSNLRQGSTRDYHRKVYDDLSREVLSSESGNPEDASRPGEETSYLRSLLSLIEQPNNRRNPDESHIDKLNPAEDAVNNLLSSANRRRNYGKEYNSHQYDLPASRIHEPSPVKDIPDAYIDTMLLITNDDQPDEIPIGRPKLGSPEQTGFGNYNLNNRKDGDGLNLDDDISGHLSPFRGLKPRLRSRKLINDSPFTRKFNRKSNDNAGLESTLNNELFPDDDKTGQLTLLRFASLGNLNLDSSFLRTGDRKNNDNRKSSRRNFIRLSLSPNNKLTLDEGVTSELSDKLSEILNELNLVPVTLRRSEPSNNQYSRRENNELSAEEDNLNNIPVLHLGSVDIPNSELSHRRYHKHTNQSNNRSLRKDGSNREALKKLFDGNPLKNLVPYHEVKNNKQPDSRRNKKLNNNRRFDFSDEFSLDTLFNFRKEDQDDRLDFEDKFSSDVSALRSTNQNHLSLVRRRSSDENPSMTKDIDDTLHIEFPCDGAQSSVNDKKCKQTVLRPKSQLMNSKEKENVKDTTDVLHLEYPWNDALSSDEGKRSQVTALRLKSPFRNSKEKDNAKDTTDVLHLEYPWNDALNSDKDKISQVTVLRLQPQLKNSKEKDNAIDTTDVLHLEYPWNDALSSDNKSNELSALRSNSQLRNSKEKDNAKDTIDVLHLEYPWNDALSSDKDKRSQVTALRLQPQLRNSKEKDNANDTTDVLHLEYPWNDALSSDNKSNELFALGSNSQLRNSKEKYNATDTTDVLLLEYPWNDALSSGNKSSKLSALRSKSMLRNSNKSDITKDTSEILDLEFPWTDVLSPDENKIGELKSHSLLRSKSDSRQDKQPKDDFKLEFPWNDKLRPDKPSTSSNKTAVRTPDPLYVHPYLRNRNMKKPPSHFRRSYDEFTEGLEKLKGSPPGSRLRHSNRRIRDSQSLGGLPLATEDFENDTVFEDEDLSAVITLPLDGSPKKLSTESRRTPSLLTTAERSNDIEFLLDLIGNKNDRKTHNDTIVFPHN